MQYELVAVATGRHGDIPGHCAGDVRAKGRVGQLPGMATLMRPADLRLDLTAQVTFLPVSVTFKDLAEVATIWPVISAPASGVRFPSCKSWDAASVLQALSPSLVGCSST